MLKKILLVVSVLLMPVIGTAIWFYSLIPDQSHRAALKETVPSELEYLSQTVNDNRGKILAVVTNTATMGDSKKSTGYELTELSRAYYVFQTNGFTVDIASPLGGEPPVVIDGDDMGPFDYAFLNDATAQGKVKNTLKVDQIDPNDYAAVYFVGGKGTMFDFPDNPFIQNIVKTHYQQGKVVGAVCHGPAALVNVVLDNGQPLIKGKQISAFTNDEELFLIPDAEQLFPFLLESQLKARGAIFNKGLTYLEKVSRDGQLITGQNPWSVWTVAENMISALGYQPVSRAKTPEENSVALLIAYENEGRKYTAKIVEESQQVYDQVLLLVHSLVAIMQWEIRKALDLMLLVSQIQNAD